MRHKRLIIATTILVFFMVCVLSLKELFTVQDITVVYSVTSTEATEDVLVLLDKYKGESIFLVSEQQITDEITANRYLKVNSVEKKYPNELVINLSERLEKYYFIGEDSKIYFFDDEFFVVAQDSQISTERKFLTQISFSNMNSNGTTESIFANCALKSTFVFPNQKNDDIGVIVNNTAQISEQIKKINFVFTQETGNYRICLTMQEGVVIEIRWAGDSLAEKINAGVAYYLSLEENQKISGGVIAEKMSSGKISAHYEDANHYNSLD